MKRLFAMLLCLVMVLSLLPAAVFAEAEETTQTMTEEEKAAILKERRDTVYNTMMSMANILWRASEDITYYFATSKVTIVKGRLYRGIPYTHARGNLNSFMDYLSEPNEKGEYTMIGATAELFDGGSQHARIGNDCSGAASVAYGSVSATTKNVGANTVSVNNGFVRVGNYKSYDNTNYRSKEDCIENGHQVMFESYALAQYADLVSCETHTMMTQNVNVVRNEDGTIDGDLSTMTVVHQNPDPIRNNRYFASGPYSEENYGEKVYRTFLIDDVWSFNKLFDSGYLPYTCIELIDPAPIPEVQVTDTIQDHSFATILDGTIKANRLMEGVTMTITDDKGEVIQQGTARVYRADASSTNSNMYYNMNQLKVESPMKIQGFLNINQLGVGNYHCRVDVRLMTGQTVEKVRDFDFTVTEKDLKEGWVDNSNLEFTEVDGKKMAVCPVCGGEPVEWQVLPQISAATSYTHSHYYLDKDLSNKSRYSMPSGMTVCIHLNGHNITSTSQVFWLGGGNSMLNVMGNGIVKGSYTSAADNYGATMHFSSATAQASLYGGTFGKTIKTEEHTITLEASQPKLTIYSGATLCRMEDARGANIAILSGVVELRGGKILDGTTIDTGYGGNVRVASSSKFTSWPSTFTMYDGVIAGGRAKYGGNVYVYRETGHGSKPRTFTMEGGLMYFGFTGYAMGNSGSGGNIWAGTGSVLNLNGGLVTYGKSYSSGGNIYAKGGSQVTIGGIVENGNGNYGSKADISGGNVYLLGAAATDTAAAVVSKLTVTGTLRNPLGTIGYGGNIFCSHSDVIVEGGTIEGGKATSRGGNIYMTNVKGNLTLKNGGKILNGSAPNGGNVSTNIASTITVESGEISGGTATTAGPDVRLHAAATVKMTGGSMGIVYGTTGKFTLSGDASIKNLTMTTGTLKLDAAWKGSMNLVYDASTITDGKLTKVTCGDSILGKVMYDHAQPVKGIAGAAYLANATVGDEIYLTAAEALAAADGNTVKLYTDDAITLIGDTYLDINGHNITATGSGTVYGIDSSNDDYEGCGTLTYAGEIAATTQDPITGKQYVAIAENGTATFHRLGGQLTAVTLRPDAAGLYFKAKYECDEVLAPLVKNYGVVLSVNNMPGADFATEEGDINIATVGGAAFVSGMETTSTSVFGILKDSRKPEQNDSYGKLPIYANTYVELENGTVIMGENGTSQSLYQVLETIDADWAAYEENQESILNFFRYWATKGISSWEFTNIQ